MSDSVSLLFPFVITKKDKLIIIIIQDPGTFHLPCPGCCSSNFSSDCVPSPRSVDEGGGDGMKTEGLDALSMLFCETNSGGSNHLLMLVELDASNGAIGHECLLIGAHEGVTSNRDTRSSK